MRQGEVLINGIRAGVITEDDNKEYLFSYDTPYLLGTNNPPVSLTLPLRNEPYHSHVLFPFFFNLLSEGENRKIQSQLLRIDPEDDFGIMLRTCSHDTIGAVTIKPITL
jgi:HipA-like protein